MIGDHCNYCGCDMLEMIGQCNCACHPVTDVLLKMNNGNREKTLRDLKSEGKMPSYDNDTGYSHSATVSGSMSMKDLIEFLRKLSPDAEVHVGNAMGKADPYNMSTEDLLKHQVYVGIKKGVLPNGFELDRDSHAEIINVLENNKPDNRIPICIAYLAGYNRGTRFGKQPRWGI